MKINTNVNAMYATNNMNKNTALAGSSMQKLASGLRINTAADDAAGLAVSEKMRAQIRGMEQGERNVQDGISLVQVAEGALAEAGEMVQRMRELGVQAGNSTLNETDRANIEVEISQLSEELVKIAEETTFNGQSLFGKDANFTVQVGANAEVRAINTIDLKEILTKQYDTGLKDDAGDAIENSIFGPDVTYDPDTGEIEDGKIDLGDIDKAQQFTGAATAVLEEITTARAKLGAQQNRLEATASNLATSIENMTEAESRIRDVDVAKEMTNLAKLNLLTQTSQAMVGQAKSQPEGIVQLLR